MCVLRNQQCIHLYGIENCVIQDKIIHPILVTWNKAVRSIWNLPNRAHSNILPILSRTRPLQEKIKLRAVSLIEKMKTIENCKTRSLVEQVKDDRVYLMSTLIVDYLFRSVMYTRVRQEENFLNVYGGGGT